MKAPPGDSDKDPQELENSRGDRIVGRANPSASGNGLLPGLTPWKARRLESASLASVIDRRKSRNAMRARYFDERCRLGSRENP